MLLDVHTSIFKTAASTLCALLVLKVAVSIIYNFFFHPLSKYPGPPLARISRLWSRIGNFQGRKSERIHEAHVKYGSVVRVGPNELSFSTPTAVQAIYTSNDFTKEESFYRAKRIFHENHLLSFRDAEAHKTRRKNFSRGFSQSSMLDFEPHISSKIKTLLNQWATRAHDGPIDVYPWCHWLGFDIIYHLMFDEDPGSVQRGQSHHVMRYIKAWKPTFIYKEFLPQMEQYGVYVPGPIGGYFRDVCAWKKYAVTLIEGIRQKDSHTPFLRNVLSEEKSGNQPLTNSELAEECMGGMFGGSGTTANTFVYILWACLRQPKVVAKLRSELLQAFPEPGLVPDYQTCSKLPYLQAVINETLRRYPTIIATLPRTANNDTVIDGIPVPKGTTVGTQNYTMHRNEDAFPSPEEFIPERWLTADGNETRKASWTPFSVGSRRCIGINLAQMELSKLTAAFFLRFDASIDEAMTEEDMRMYDTFNAGPAASKVHSRKREVNSSIQARLPAIINPRLAMNATRVDDKSGRKVVKRRKIALACEYCRKRKTRCDGRQPACSACEAKGLSATCLYQQSYLTTKRYVSDLEARVQEYERRSQTTLLMSSVTSETTTDRNFSPAQDTFLSQRKNNRHPEIRQQPGMAMTDDPASVSYPHLESFQSGDRFLSPPRTESVSSDAMVVVPSPECSDDKDLGQSSSISFIQSMLRTVTRDHSVFKVSHHPAKSSYPFLQTLDEEALFLPPRRVADGFVQAYWKFLHPILPILHRPTFTGIYHKLWMADDAKGSDQICNIDDAVFLSTVNIVLAIGCQFSEQIEPTRKSTMASKFYQRSKALLADEVLDHPTLALVQLLLLTGVYLQSTEYANRCWNTVGLAIRSAQSIGLHLDRKRGSINQLEREMERRVWHTCVFLDRQLACTFGRPPMILDSSSVPKPEMINDEYLSETRQGVQPTNAYPQMGCFVYSCDLFDILHQILVEFYVKKKSNPHSQSSDSWLGEEIQVIMGYHRELNKFQESLPAFLATSDSYMDSPSQELVAHMYDNMGTSYWTSISHKRADAFACVVVLAAARLCTVLNGDIDKASIQASWSQCMRVFEEYKLHSPAASHVIRILGVLETRLPGFGPGINNFPLETQTNTGERDAMAEHEDDFVDGNQRLLLDSGELVGDLPEIDVDSTWALLDDLLQCEPSGYNVTNGTSQSSLSSGIWGGFL
ncbi:benzoate 4-monooxygenase [Fusarium mundagurra]|uniref:Benzoate 4-monooxygenase n=1 Tax=Fusarium mundagurra TaxID=1567541 RepID=A0A8H6DNE7_9HYPO|nr:benzoate 4-monooxygenase [Fusarium mundagurra]